MTPQYNLFAFYSESIRSTLYEATRAKHVYLVENYHDLATSSVHGPTPIASAELPIWELKTLLKTLVPKRPK